VCDAGDLSGWRAMTVKRDGSELDGERCQEKPARARYEWRSECGGESSAQNRARAG